MAPKDNNIRFPLWQFLNQPLFNRKSKFILNPQRFWYMYTITLLERCWEKQYESEGRHRNH